MALEMPFEFTTLIGQAAPTLQAVLAGSVKERDFKVGEGKPVRSVFPCTSMSFPCAVNPLPASVRTLPSGPDAGVIESIFGGFWP